MKVTEDMKADRDWLVQTHNRTAGGTDADTRIAWNDLSEAGWSDVFARISGTWRLFDDQRRPTNRMPFRDRHALLQTCGVFKAGLVLAALDLWVASPDGARPPAAADLYALIAQPQGAQGKANLEPPVRRDQRPEALAFVAGLISDGRKVCECCPAPMTLVRDEHDTLWCPNCGGIEMGQADAATAGPEEPDADVELRDLGAVIRLRRVREAA